MSRNVTEDLVAKLLTKKDLDERISLVATELFGSTTDEQDRAPIAISTADFVRRMRRFIVYN